MNIEECFLCHAAKWQKTDIRCDVCGSEEFKNTEELAAHRDKHTSIGNPARAPHAL
jgi:hypothetical protein